MRLLADENFPGPVIAALAADGHDIVSVASLHPGVDDSAVLALAQKEGRWLLTFDADFGDLVFLRNHPAPPAILLFRLHPIVSADVLAAARRALGEVAEGHFAVVGRETTRLRPFRLTPARG
jgi:predicted nuclease of predicted toxin-antitoxin system